MAKKQKSFAEKVVKQGGKEMVHVKFVKSVASNKEGYWRFNESMISMEKGESLAATLKRMDDEANLADIEMSPAVEVAEGISEVVVETAEAVADEAPLEGVISEKGEEQVEEVTEETPTEASADAVVEETAVETVEEESVEDSSPEKGEEQVEEVTEETPEAESTEEKSE
jgi:hypothetical protein